MENKLMMVNTQIDNDNFLSDNDPSLSPKSETEKVLFIDESIDHSIMDHTTLSDDLMENEPTIIMDTKVEISSKVMDKKTQKQQCFTCGKVMSSRQVSPLFLSKIIWGQGKSIEIYQLLWISFIYMSKQLFFIQKFLFFFCG